MAGFIGLVSVARDGMTDVPLTGRSPHLFLSPGAGVTPAQGSVKPTAGFTFNQVKALLRVYMALPDQELTKARNRSGARAGTSKDGDVHFAREILTTTSTTKGANAGEEYALRRTD